MIHSLKQRLLRMENTLGRIRETNTRTHVDTKVSAVDESWLQTDEVGSRAGPDATCNESTRRIYDMIIRMEEATCRTNTEEI